MIRLAICLVVMLLGGCGTERQVQALADAKVGAEAYRAESDPAKRAVIAAGMADAILGGLANYPGLPSPSATVSELQADPGSYAASCATYAADPPPFNPGDLPSPPGPTPPSRLAEIGDAVLTWGGIALALGAVLSLVGLASKWFPLGWVGSVLTSPILAPLTRLATSLGGCGVIVGAALSWLSAWLWAVVLACVLAGAGAAIYHRRGIVKAWRRLFP
jgi:hypothetical protein